MTLRPCLPAMMGVVLLCLMSPVQAGGSVGVELNKLEDAKGGCRTYLVFENGTDNSFTVFKLDMVMFGRDGVIAKRLAVDAAPLRPRKTTVKLFDIPGVLCVDVGKVLINDVMDCRDRGKKRANCIELVTTSSRTDVKLIK